MTALLTASGEKHGLINKIGNSVAFDDFKHMDPKTKAKVEKEKKEDARMVKGRYMHKSNHERLDKPYCKYAGDPICIYHLIPGYVYELPMGMINEVNGQKKVTRSGLVSVDGEPVKKDESPLDKDMYRDSDHQIVPVSF